MKKIFVGLILLVIVFSMGSVIVFADEKSMTIALNKQLIEQHELTRRKIDQSVDKCNNAVETLHVHAERILEELGVKFWTMFGVFASMICALATMRLFDLIVALRKKRAEKIIADIKSREHKQSEEIIQGVSKEVEKIIEPPKPVVETPIPPEHIKQEGTNKKILDELPKAEEKEAGDKNGNS